MDRPAIRHLLPMGNEYQWADLLAMLVERDPVTAARLFGFPASGALVVRREHVRDDAADRVDLVLRVEDTGEAQCVIECKVGADVDVWQLQRYIDRWPESPCFVLITLFEVSGILQSNPVWTYQSWRYVLDGFQYSDDTAVAALATQGLQRIRQELDCCDGGTRWDSPDATAWAKLTWLLAQVHLTEFCTVALARSTAGAPLLSLDTGAVDDHLISIELQDAESRRHASSKGPMTRLMLVNTGVETSASFDWHRLKDLQPLIEGAEVAWRDGAGRRTEAEKSDRDAAMVPAWMSYGYGDRQAAKWNWCGFGPAWKLAPDTPLAEVAESLVATLTVASKLEEQFRHMTVAADDPV